MVLVWGRLPRVSFSVYNANMTRSNPHGQMHALSTRASSAPSHHNRMTTSKQGTLHSRTPIKLLSHPNPTPVHSVRGCSRRPTASSATPAKVDAVWLNALNRNEASALCSVHLEPPWLLGGIGFGKGDEYCRSSNQLASRSKKHLSDQ